MQNCHLYVVAMNLQVLVLCFWIAGLPCPVLSISCAEFQNGGQYSVYESMLLAHDINAVDLEQGFFPTNYHSSVVVDVNYHFIFTSETSDLEMQEEEPFLNITAAEISHYRFRWMVSPINLFIRPNLLSSLSLKTYQTRNVSMDLYLGLPYNCTPEVLNRILNSSASICNDPPAHLYHLNTLTTNVS